jgi:tetratricopeptide (TPR) repeat protein
MLRILAIAKTLVVCAVLLSPLAGQDGANKQPHKELDDARKTAWELAHVVVDKLEEGDPRVKKFARIWLKDFRKVAAGVDPNVPADQWPAIDVDALVARNPHFWPAYFEIAPGDPGLILLHACLLLSAGEAERASHVLVLGEQRRGIPKAVRQGFEQLLAHTQQVGKRPGAVLNQGIKLHDQGKYDAAITKYREALELWPQFGLAHYEIGLTLMVKEYVAVGEKPPALDSVTVNKGKKLSAAVQAAFAKTRQHAPFEYRAYQGDDQELLKGLTALVQKGVPAWQAIAQNRPKQADSKHLKDLALACQEAGYHELALTAGQMLAARRGRYAPEDHPFIAKSLRKLAPGDDTEAVLKRLAGEAMTVRQLFRPEPEPADPNEVIGIRQLRLYVPGPEMATRVGKDVMPLADYIKALTRAASAALEKEKLDKAKGLLIAVGIKPGKKSRVWCESVGGEIAEAVLRDLEKELAKVEPISVKNGAVAFGIEAMIRGQNVDDFPQFPRAWLEAAKTSNIRIIVPPDELFKVLWAEQ